MGTRKNTQFTVRPDVLDTSTISALNHEEGVIVWDKDIKKLMNNTGSGWNPLFSGSQGSTDIAQDIQGYYGVLTDFYFGGSATETQVLETDINTFIDVNITPNSLGIFDNRITSMKEAQATGHSGSGLPGVPMIFDLEGLSTTAFCTFRASMEFTPDDDQARLESRVLFNRHSGTSPSDDFSIEEISVTMESGADISYITEPTLTFFVGDTIDTNADGDAGKLRFQIKSDVPGTLSLRALTLYINK